MMIRFERGDLFDCRDPKVYAELQRLFMRVAQGQHRLDVPEPEKILTSDFMKVGCAAMNRVEWEELLTRAWETFSDTQAEPEHYALVRRPRAAVGGCVAYALLPSEVGDWAEQPLRVLLENAHDHVLLTVAERVCNAEKLKDARERQWLVYDGRGGCGEVKNTVERSANLDRLFVVADSDRTEWKGQEGSGARSIRAACGHKDRSHRIEVHVLTRRELENYVPQLIWETVIAAQPRAQKIEQPSAAQQRRVHVYRWLERRLEESIDWLRGKYGDEAVRHVAMAIGKQARRALDGRLLRDLLAEWCALSAEERAVDDLKIRFSERLAGEAVANLGKSDFDPAWLDEDAREELAEVVKKLEAWL